MLSGILLIPAKKTEIKAEKHRIQANVEPESSTETLGEHSLLLYPHINPPYNAVKMLYVGSEVAKDVEVKIHYIDKDGIKQERSVTEFFPRIDPGMWKYHDKYDYLEPEQLGYFRLVQKKSTSDGKATVSISFTGAKSGTPVNFEREFKLGA